MQSVQLTLMIGPTVPVPVPPLFVEALETTEVSHGDEGRSGFQLTFKMGRSGQGDGLDYALLASPLLRPFSRVAILVTFDGSPLSLMDGVITDLELAPSNQPGASRLTVTGEDISLMMDLEERQAEYPALGETAIATLLIERYKPYGLVAAITPPIVIDPLLPGEGTRVQTDTDLGFLRELAARHGYVFYVAAGPAPPVNTAWWGPPRRFDLPQRALSVNMGPDTNVESIRFHYSALEQSVFHGSVQDRRLGVAQPYRTVVPRRLPPFAALPAAKSPFIRDRLTSERGGLTYIEALERAQGRTDASADKVLTASGELDALRYGSVLQARGVVGVRGAGYLHDGLYYVKRVSHTIRQDQYTQKFTLVREGHGSTVPAVVP